MGARDRSGVVKRRGLLAGTAALTAAAVAHLSQVRTVLAAPIAGDSATVAPAVKGTNTSGVINAVAVQALVTGTNGAAVQATIGQATSPTSVGSYAVNAYHDGSGTAILAKSNAGTGLIGLGGGTAVAIRATSLGSGHALFGESSFNAGVYGRSTTNAGVFGDSPLVAVGGVSTGGIGVQGTSTTNAGIYGQSTGNAAVYGTSPFAGVYGTSSSVGVWGVSSGGTGVFGQSTGAGGFAGQFAGNVYISGSLTVASGAKSAAVKRKDGSHARVYCQESPEPWFEDFGTAELRGGQASVPLSSDFDEVVDGNDYRVFLTAIGDLGTLYVSRKGPHRFEVRSERGAAVNGPFDYRVVARRAEPVGKRMELVTVPSAAPSRPGPRGLDGDALPKPPASLDLEVHPAERRSP